MLCSIQLSSLVDYDNREESLEKFEAIPLELKQNKENFSTPSKISNSHGH